MALPDPVISGQPVTSEWGNDVVDTLVAHQASIVANNTQAFHGWEIFVAQGFSTGTTTVAWNNENNDSDAYHVTNSTEVVIPATMGGVYAVSLRVKPTGAVGYICNVFVGSYGFDSLVIPANGGPMTGTSLVRLNVGDILTCNVAALSTVPAGQQLIFSGARVTQP